MNNKLIAGFVLAGAAGSGLFHLGSFIVDKKEARDYAILLSQPVQLSWKRSVTEEIRESLSATLENERGPDLVHSQETVQALDLIWNELSRSPQLSPQLSEDLLNLPYLFEKLAFHAARVQHARTVDKAAVNEFVSTVENLTELLDDIRATAGDIEDRVILDGSRPVHPDELFARLARVLDTYRSAASAASALASHALPEPPAAASAQPALANLEKSIEEAHEQLRKNELAILKELDRLAAQGRHRAGRSDREADALRILAQQGIRSLTYATLLSSPNTQTEHIRMAAKGFSGAYRIVRALTDMNSNVWATVPHDKNLGELLAPATALISSPLDQFTLAVLPHLDKMADVTAENDRIERALASEASIVLWRATDNAVSPTRFADSVDAFQFLNSVSIAASEQQRKSLVESNLPVALGTPRIQNVEATDDGGYAFDIASTSSDFRIAARIPASPDTKQLNVEKIKASRPAVAFALRDNTLYLTGVGLELAGSPGRVFSGTTTIRVPVTFTEEAAATWKIAYAAKQAAKQVEAEQAAEAERKLAIENQKKLQQHLASDPVYVYAQRLAEGTPQLPVCQMLIQQMLNVASSNAPDYVRERQVDAMFDRMPRICRE